MIRHTNTPTSHMWVLILGVVLALGMLTGIANAQTTCEEGEKYLRQQGISEIITTTKPSGVSDDELFCQQLTENVDGITMTFSKGGTVHTYNDMDKYVIREMVGREQVEELYEKELVEGDPQYDADTHGQEVEKYIIASEGVVGNQMVTFLKEDHSSESIQPQLWIRQLDGSKFQIILEKFRDGFLG